MSFQGRGYLPGVSVVHLAAANPKMVFLGHIRSIMPAASLVAGRLLVSSIVGWILALGWVGVKLT